MLAQFNAFLSDTRQLYTSGALLYDAYDTTNVRTRAELTSLIFLVVILLKQFDNVWVASLTLNIRFVRFFEKPEGTLTVTNKHFNFLKPCSLFD